MTAPAQEVSTKEDTGDRIANLSPLSKVSFDRLKERQEEGSSAEDISDLLEHDVADIRIAMESTSYLPYTFNRKKALAAARRH